MSIASHRIATCDRCGREERSPEIHGGQPWCPDRWLRVTLQPFGEDCESFTVLCPQCAGEIRRALTRRTVARAEAS